LIPTAIDILLVMNIFKEGKYRSEPLTFVPDLKFLLNVIKSDAASVKGLCILEFGSGPCLASLISAAPYAEKIVFSEFVGKMRIARVLEKQQELWP
jgi:hypothetical protein